MTKQNFANLLNHSKEKPLNVLLQPLEGKTDKMK